MKTNELLKRIEAKTAPVIIDARSRLEFKRGHIPGAIHAPVLKILLKRARLPENKHSELAIT
jgi:rhodanese-related sulfurtransferase